MTFLVENLLLTSLLIFFNYDLDNENLPYIDYQRRERIEKYIYKRESDNSHLLRKMKRSTTYGLDSDVGKNCFANLCRYMLPGRPCLP